MFEKKQSIGSGKCDWWLIKSGSGLWLPINVTCLQCRGSFIDLWYDVSLLIEAGFLSDSIAVVSLTKTRVVTMRRTREVLTVRLGVSSPAKVWGFTAPALSWCTETATSLNQLLWLGWCPITVAISRRSTLPCYSVWINSRVRVSQGIIEGMHGWSCEP